MKKTILALMLASSVGIAAAQDHTENIVSECNGGGQKSIVYHWVINTGDISYLATLTNCKPSPSDNRNFNGTIAGNGKLLVTNSGFSVNMAAQEALTVTGADIGSSNCETGIQGDFNQSTGAFNGALTKNKCVYTTNTLGTNLVELLTTISFK